MRNEVDAYIARLQNLSAYNIHHPTQDGHSTVPWMVVDGKIAYELVIDELNIPAQVDLLAVQLGVWGRYLSIAERSWQIVERGYRQWRDRFCLKLLDGGEKKPSEANLERQYRADPEYAVWNKAIEEAQEAVTATKMIHDAFKAKGQLLTAYASLFRETTKR